MAEKKFNVKAKDIKIEQDGRVVIDNPDYAEMLKEHMESLSTNEDTIALLDNCNCDIGVDVA